MQHQYLKSYTPIQDSYYENQTDYKHHYYPYQTDSSFTDTTQSSSSASTPLPSLTNMRSLVSQSPPQQPSPQQPSPQQPLPQQPLLQQPLLQQPSPQQQPPPQQPPPPLLQPRPSPPTMPTITEHNPLKTVIDQCTSIYEQIGKYRADPLRESERNRIIDHVYKTAEMMLQSLKEMEGTRVENPDSIMIDYASDDISSTTSAIKLNEDQYQPMNEEYKMIRQARNLQENSRPKYRRRSVSKTTSNIHSIVLLILLYRNEVWLVKGVIHVIPLRHPNGVEAQMVRERFAMLVAYVCYYLAISVQLLNVFHRLF
jgi:hypothetical protein